LISTQLISYIPQILSLPVDSIFKTLSRVECSPVSVRLRIIHHNISIGLTNTNNNASDWPGLMVGPCLGPTLGTVARHDFGPVRCQPVKIIPIHIKNTKPNFSSSPSFPPQPSAFPISSHPPDPPQALSGSAPHHHHRLQRLRHWWPLPLKSA
jgi:hypothetical protein